MKTECFARGMSMLLEAFGAELGDAGMEAYWLVLMDLEASAFDDAVARALRGSRFMPKPSELLPLAAGGVDDAEAEIRQLVERAFTTVGSYRSVTFDPSINAAIRLLGGWPSLCALDRAEWRNFRARELVKLALAYRNGRHIGGNGVHLAGSAELSNQSLSAPVPVEVTHVTLGGSTRTLVQPPVSEAPQLASDANVGVGAETEVVSLIGGTSLPVDLRKS